MSNKSHQSPYHDRRNRNFPAHALRDHRAARSRSPRPVVTGHHPHIARAVAEYILDQAGRAERILVVFRNFAVLEARIADLLRVLRSTATGLPAVRLGGRISRRGACRCYRKMSVCRFRGGTRIRRLLFGER